MDFFKKPFIFLFQQQKQSSTFIGFLFSMGMLFLVLYMFFRSDMLNKTNPYLDDQIITQNHASLITLSPENFEIAVGVTDYLGSGCSDPTIFRLDVIQAFVDYNSTSKKKYVSSLEYMQTRPCSPNITDAYERFGLQNYECLFNETLEVEGMFDEKQVTAVVVKITFCNNETSNNTCQSQADITTYFSDKSLFLYYQDTMYDVSNYDDPIKTIWRLISLDASYGTPRVNNIYFRKLELITDDNVIFSSDRDIKYGWIKEAFEGNSDLVMINTEIITVNFLSSKNLQHCERTYQKLGELVAIIGGFLNIIIIFSLIITNLVNDIKMKNFIMNNLYSYSFDEKIKKREKNEVRSEDWDENYDEGTTKRFVKIGGAPQNTNAIIISQNNDEVEKFSPRQMTSKNNDEVEKLSPRQMASENQEILASSDKCKLVRISPLLEQGKFVVFDIENKNISSPFHIEINKLEKSKSITDSKRFCLSPEIKRKELTTSQSLALTPKTEELFPLYMNAGIFLKFNLKLMLNRKLNQKEQLFLISDEKFREEIDIINILQRAQEINLLITILLDEDQRKMLNYLAKQILYLENKKKKAQKLINGYFRRVTLSGFQEGNRKVQKKILALKNYHETLSKKSNLSIIDKNLLSLIEKRIYS